MARHARRVRVDLNRNYFPAFLILFLSSAALSTQIIAALPPRLAECQNPQNSPPLFVFGDSYFDSGNNNYINTTTLDQANFWPYGESFFNFPTGRFSDGRLITDFIAEYAKVPWVMPFLQPGNDECEKGVNFASAGAGVLAETFKGAVLDLKTQLRNYKKVEAGLRRKWGDLEGKKIVSRGIYLFSIGTNDYMSLFLTNSTALLSFSHSEYVGMVISNLTLAIKEIYEVGGRKFVFLNLGDLGCLPGLRFINHEEEGGCLKEVSVLADLHNRRLSDILSKLEMQLPGFRYSLYDFNSSLRDRMNHPSKYGFKEGKSACCGTGRFRGGYSCGGKRPTNKKFELCENPKDYVFWDSYHLTEKVYRQMAEQMWIKPGNGSYNLKTLLLCL